MSKISFDDLATLRVSSGFSQEKLAEICDVSTRTIQRIEKDGFCSQDIYSKLSNIFNLPKKISDNIDPTSLVNKDLKSNYSEDIIKNHSKYISYDKYSSTAMILLFCLSCLLYVLTLPEGEKIFLFSAISLSFLLIALLVINRIIQINTAESYSLALNLPEIKEFHELKTIQNSQSVIYNESCYQGINLKQVSTYIFNQNNNKDFVINEDEHWPDYFDVIDKKDAYFSISFIKILQSKDGNYFILENNNFSDFSEVKNEEIRHIAKSDLMVRLSEHKPFYEATFGPLSYK